MHTFDLNVDDLSKIEGKASLTVRVENDEVKECKFGITEFKRFYTQALTGKDVVALPQLSCRICGTCSNAHLLCAIKAAENALGIKVSEQTKALRKLLNFGLMIRDHALHLYVFALPDVIGVDNILDIDEKDEKNYQLLHDTFEVKAAGNNLSKVVGGRSVHAPYPTVGGFMKLPDPNEFPALVTQLESIRPAVLRLIRVFLECPFRLDRETEYVALMDDEYSFLDGVILNTASEKISPVEFGRHLNREVIPYSHASGYTYDGKIHMIGALARLNLAKDRLHVRTKNDAQEALAIFPSHNIYHNNLAQAIEILHSIDTAVDMLKTLTIVGEKPAPIVRTAACGTGVIEAPRGTLYYGISMDGTGKMDHIEIVVPTGQNQIGIEQGIGRYIADNLDKNQDALISDVEKIVRAYDPCMSCASHFLKANWTQVKK